MEYLIGHLAGDFLMQNRWMAQGKKKRWLPLLSHTLIYTLCIGLTTGWRPGALAAVAAAHLVLDGTDLVRLYNARVKGDAPALWLDIATDQALHLLVLFGLYRTHWSTAPADGLLGALLVLAAALAVALYRLVRLPVQRAHTYSSPLRRTARAHARKRRQPAVS